MQDWPEDVAACVQNFAYDDEGRIKALTVASKAEALGKAMKYLQLLESGPRITTRRLTRTASRRR
jgi:hypothetical protein